eukprot:m.306739 g.306739  ORF g.306739 m.306739 type:complete len:333 (+) comp41546_c0_seq1:80-1078(+)
MAEPLTVCITGAAGQIGYALLHSVASGDVFGKDQPIILTLLDIEPMLGALGGVAMELQDCALPILREVIVTADPYVSFKNVDVAILVGSMPRREGMLRKDLLKANAGIFSTQGKALDTVAKKTVKVLVVGNPANTNCLIALKNAPSIPSSSFTCLTRLDQNRAQAQIAARQGVRCDQVHNVIIWGNHSSTQYPDASHGHFDGGASVFETIKDDAWLKGDFITTVQKRGAAVIAARKLSSALSAAKAISDHMRDWWFGTKPGNWVSMGVLSDGSHYDIPEGLIYSVPVRIENKTWKLVEGLPISEFSRQKMQATTDELVEERDAALVFLPSKQ